MIQSRKIVISIKRIENTRRRWSPEYDEVGRGVPGAGPWSMRRRALECQELVRRSSRRRSPERDEKVPGVPGGGPWSGRRWSED